jgi:predicted nucleic acid-binding Zn ribbon protein
VICKKCGAEVMDNAVYCPKCGENIKKKKYNKKATIMVIAIISVIFIIVMDQFR